MSKKVKIIISSKSGFCFGVKRSIDMLEELHNKNLEEKIYTYGPIIHNEHVVNHLKEKNIFPILDDKNLMEINENSTLVIRSHGVGNNKIDELKQKGFNIVNGTCPFVKKVHETGLKLIEEGYKIILIGEKNHPEVIGIAETLNNNLVIINSLDDVESIKINRNKKVGIIIQTTQEFEKVNKILLKLFNIFKEIKIHNTICNATYIRQQWAIKLSKKVDLMLIIGSKHSGNTNRLFEICSNYQKKSYLCSDEKDIDKIDFSGVEEIGISAGASTPEWIIKKIVDKISALYDNYEVKFLNKNELEDCYELY